MPPAAFLPSSAKRSCSIKPAQLAALRQPRQSVVLGERAKYAKCQRGLRFIPLLPIAPRSAGRWGFGSTRALAAREIAETIYKFLRTEEARSAPTNGISIRVKCHRTTRPVTTGASDRRPNGVSRVGHVAGLHDVSRPIRVGNCAANDSARHHTSSDADTDSTAPTTGFSRRSCEQGNCHGCGSSKREHGLVHGRLLHNRG
jgi:hypothetical protein